MNLISNFSAWLRSLNESSKSKYEYGCAMVYYDFPQMKELHDLISPDDIYHEAGDNSYGLEDEPHTTLLFGFHEDVPADEVLSLCKEFKYPDLKLHKASCFNNEKYDVLKFDVDSPALHNVNKAITSRFADRYTTDYPDYHPHCTIVYVKKGKGQQYADLINGSSYNVTPKKLVYSMPNGKKKEMAL
jgi:2'-5' RNA ligase